MISSPGLGSGLDVTSLVNQLVAIEEQPLIRLANKEAEFLGQITAFGSLKSALSTFQGSLSKINSLADFRKLSAKSSDTDVLSASASPTASKGTYEFTVERLAESHRLGSSSVFIDADATAIGTTGDTITFTQGGETFDVEFGDKTLAEIRNLINDASDNTGVTASILKDDTGYRLLVNATNTGGENLVDVSYSGADPFSLFELNSDRDGDLSFTAADLDAELTIDGVFTATTSSNTVTDVVQGVTISLLEEGTSTLTINDDNSGVVKAVESFVDAYNSAIDAIKKLRAGDLNDDSNTLLAVENQIRGILNSSIRGNGSYTSIYEVGLSSTFVLGGPSEENGKLSIDTDALLSALDDDQDSVATLFADPDNGIISALDDLLGSFVDFNGLIDGKTDSLNRRIGSVTTSQEIQTRRVESYEARLFAEFNALDVVIAQLELSSDFITQQLALLQPTNGRGVRR
ncbi:MAG: flagellar hook-associated protein 2 [Gammaproteobacteria bacterium]|jgi:flagellar hook-associated protein 2